MEINKDKTIAFYTSYIPCNCGDCKIYIRNIEKMYPEICAYLTSIGVNPLKPFELMSIDDGMSQLEFVSCEYIVFGNADNDFKITINNMDIEVSYLHPILDTKDDYFILMFGPIMIEKIYSNTRHLTHSDIKKTISKILYDFDIMNLIDKLDKEEASLLANEYIQEANIIEIELSKRRNLIGFPKFLQKTFYKQFDQVIEIALCRKITYEIASQLEVQRDFKDFEENKRLKGKISIEDFEYKLVIHPNFIVTTLDRNTYINGKLYYDIEEQDLLESYIDFVDNNDYIYIQYKRKQLLSARNYFRLVHKNKYDFIKLKNKKQIELIFDNNGVIFKK